MDEMTAYEMVGVGTVHCGARTVDSHYGLIEIDVLRNVCVSCVFEIHTI